LGEGNEQRHSATQTIEGTVHADDVGRNDPPWGDVITRKITSPAAVMIAANHVTPRIDWWSQS